MNIFHNRSGQGMVVEYAVTFFMVLAFAAGMALYVRRAVQGRIHDVNNYIMNETEKVVLTPAACLVGVAAKQYEPYYIQAETLRTHGLDLNETSEPTGALGIHKKSELDFLYSETKATQAPPVNAY